MSDYDFSAIDYENLDYKLIPAKRKLLGLTQEKLGKFLGAGRATVISYEGGSKIPSTRLPLLKKFFEAETAADLFSEDNIDSYNNSYEKLPCGRYSIRVPFVPTIKCHEFVESTNTDNVALNFLVSEINQGILIAFEIPDKSMDDGSKESLAQGDIALALEIETLAFKKLNDHSDIWIFILADRLVCRKVERYNPKSNEVKCIPLNNSSEYSVNTYNLKFVKKIYKVVQRVTTL